MSKNSCKRKAAKSQLRSQSKYICRLVGWIWIFVDGDLRQIRRTHQVAVTFTRRAATFIERPDHKTLTATAIAASKHLGEVCVVFLELRLCIAARVTFNAKGFEQRLFRAEKTHRQQDEVRRQNFFRSGHVLRDE